MHGEDEAVFEERSRDLLLGSVYVRDDGNDWWRAAGHWGHDPLLRGL